MSLDCRSRPAMTIAFIVARRRQSGVGHPVFPVKTGIQRGVRQAIGWMSPGRFPVRLSGRLAGVHEACIMPEAPGIPPMRESPCPQGKPQRMKMPLNISGAGFSPPPRFQVCGAGAKRPHHTPLDRWGGGRNGIFMVVTGILRGNDRSTERE